MKEEIVRGCIAKCSRGEYGLVTSERMVLTKMGYMAWCGIHLSPKKAGMLWSSRKPVFIAKSIKHLINGGR